MIKPHTKQIDTTDKNTVNATPLNLDEVVEQKTILDTNKMLEEINKLVQTDFCSDMCGKQLPETEPYTQKEALDMAEIIGKIYTISHCTTCTGCRVKWMVNNK